MGEAKTITKTCGRCGRSFETSNNRLRVCPTCRARGRRSGGGGGGRRTFSAARVLARASAPGGNGGGAISVNTGYYRRPDDGMPPVVVLRGDGEGMLDAMRGHDGWIAVPPGLTLDQMAEYLADRYGYALADRNGREVTLARDIVREVASC